MLVDGRVEEPDYAFMNNSEVFELMSVQGSVEGILAPEWEELEGAALRRFLDGTQPLVRPAERWHPRQEIRSLRSLKPWAYRCTLPINSMPICLKP